MGKRRCTAIIKLPGPESLVEALEADNRVTPPWVEVSCRADPKGDVITCEVTVEGCELPQRILTLRNTVIDLISCYRAASDAIKRVETFQDKP